MSRSSSSGRSRINNPSQDLISDDGILLQSAHATGGAPAGARTVTSGVGGDGFVIIPVLNI